MKRSGIKATIEYIVRLLNVIGVTCLTPETIRQAKFNSPGVTDQLWRALHDLILLALAHFPVENPGKRLQELWARLNEEGQPPGCAANIEFVQYYMGIWRYPHPSLFRQKSDGEDSRCLLLAVAWLCSQQKVLHLALERHLASSAQPAPSAPLPPYPEDTWHTEG
eukprot:CAMPEP_0118939916 /NCGR_PEP_ID=MMETSP1169-20130426/30178_1 /TAXON_ID=36882 /ORGANISM="Pyramimonas obovata, Strain CCMP722" /LENGTH=164 /DNA_ID=CAMNT_0006884291 /DNA_START=130 /DNA_END=621 /DNA_ORIENTATION=-